MNENPLSQLVERVIATRVPQVMSEEDRRKFHDMFAEEIGPEVRRHRRQACYEIARK